MIWRSHVSPWKYWGISVIPIIILWGWRWNGASSCLGLLPPASSSLFLTVVPHSYPQPPQGNLSPDRCNLLGPRHWKDVAQTLLLSLQIVQWPQHSQGTLDAQPGDSVAFRSALCLSHHSKHGTHGCTRPLIGCPPPHLGVKPAGPEASQSTGPTTSREFGQPHDLFPSP